MVRGLSICTVLNTLKDRIDGTHPHLINNEKTNTLQRNVDVSSCDGVVNIIRGGIYKQLYLWKIMARASYSIVNCNWFVFKKTNHVFTVTAENVLQLCRCTHDQLCMFLNDWLLFIAYI